MQKTQYEEFRKFAKDKGVHESVLSDYANEINNMTPNIIEERNLNVAMMDVFSRLMMDRIIFLGTPVNDHIANIIQAQLLFLQSTDNEKDISIYINSPGGSVYPGLGIYDTMNYVNCDISTICTGIAASMAAVLLAGGKNGKRSALPHSRVMIHQPLGGMQGQAKDMEITLNQTLEIKKDLYNILAHHTGQNYEKIENDSDRDFWLRAEGAKEYGLIDDVLRNTNNK